MIMKMQYQVVLNLQEKASESAAILFWEKKEVKERVREFFNDSSEFNLDQATKEWRKLTKVLINEFYNEELLPLTLKDGYIHIIKPIGEKIFNWYNYIKYENESQLGVEEKTINYLDKIYWTSGAVDEVETLKSCWLKNSNLNPAKLYITACNNALEGHINDLWNKIPKEIQDNCFNDIYKDINQHILAYWKCWRDGDLPSLMRNLEVAVTGINMQEFNSIYNLNLSIEENMFRLSVHQGHTNAMKYFWNKLTEEMRSRDMLGCARMAVQRYNFYEQRPINGDHWIGEHKKERYIEICIFLINQLNESDKKSFFNDETGLSVLRCMFIERIDMKDEVLRMLLSTWPWEELFMPVLKDMLEYQDDNSKMVCMFLDAITDKMREEHELGYNVDFNKYRGLLHESWRITPGYIKKKIVREYSKFDFIWNLIEVWDLVSLKLILDDPDIAEVRDAFIAFGNFSYEQFILTDQFERLDQLIEEIFRSEDEKKRFKQELSVWNDIFCKGNSLPEETTDDDRLLLANKVLEWQCSTPEEKQFVKNRINSFEICKHLIISRHFNLADKYLNWRFSTEEEKRELKNTFINDLISTNHIYEIWKYCKSDIDKAKKDSFEFLRWFLESEEEIENFKKERIGNFQSDYIAMIHLLPLKDNGSINEFLSWCLLPDEEIQRLKQIVVNRHLPGRAPV